MVEIIENENENDKGMKKINYNSDNVEWDKIRNELKEIQWNEIFKDKDTETCLNILLEIIIKLCKKYIPEKKSRNKSTIPKRRRQLFHKMKLLRRSKRNANNKRKKVIDNKILEVEKEILNHKKEERDIKEKRVIENMNKKPKIFHDFVKNKESTDYR